MGVGVEIKSALVDYKDFSGLDLTQSLPQQAFLRLLERDSQVTGDILNIGAGPKPDKFLVDTFDKDHRIDGVDVDPKVLDNPQLRASWHAPFESADIATEQYQLAFAYNVVEHIEHARPFFEKIATVLNPGGIFWAYTPYAFHPFALLSRLIEVVGFKGFFAKHNEDVNDYPAYYRLNSERNVLRAVEGLPFDSIEFFYFYAPNWKQYFPRPVRFAPIAYDKLTQKRSPGIIAYRLTKSSTVAQ